MIRGILTDIEGTTTPLAFVHEALFPYARARLAEFCRLHHDKPEVALVFEAVRELQGAPELTLEQTIEVLLRWMAEDRKAGPLKELQGFIWREGYGEGVLKGPVYDDAAACLHKWHDAGLRLFVYSSGSVEAQKLIFGYSDKGDLTSLFSGYFDTAVGPKVAEASYTKIAKRVGLKPSALLFLSDHAGEVAAAKAAGFAVALIDRDRAEDESEMQDGTLVAGSFMPVAESFDLPS